MVLAARNSAVWNEMMDIYERNYKEVQGGTKGNSFRILRSQVIVFIVFILGVCIGI